MFHGTGIYRYTFGFLVNVGSIFESNSAFGYKKSIQFISDLSLIFQSRLKNIVVQQDPWDISNFLRLHKWLISFLMGNLGTYTIHGCYGYCNKGSLFYQPKQYIIMKEIPKKKCHAFVLCEPPNMGPF